MDPWQRIESLSQELKYMNENIKGYRQSLKVAKAEKEVCRVQTKAPPPFLFPLPRLVVFFCAFGWPS